MSVWTLYDGAEPLGEVHIEEADFPSLFGRFKPTPAFEPWRPRFDEHSRLAGCTEDDDSEETVRRFEEHWAAMSAPLRLVDPDGVELKAFLLYIDGDDAGFRGSYDAFDEP